MDKINKIVIVIMCFLVFLFLFGYQILLNYPFGEDIEYEERYHTGELIEKNNNNYTTIYNNSDNCFVGLQIEDNELFDYPSLVSKSECIDFYLQKAGNDIYFNYKGIKVHIRVISYKVSLLLKSYSAIVSIYYDNCYIQNHISDSHPDYEKIDFTNKEEIIKVSKTVSDKLIQVYQKNEKAMKEVFNSQI
ncbi:MAG: hypothetical protein ACLUVC_07325 [Longibaculum sp.]